MSTCPSVEVEAVGDVVVEFAVPSSEAVSFRPGECGLTSPAATAAAKPVVGAGLSGIAENSATTESVCAVSRGQAGFYGSNTGGMDSAGATGIVESVGEALPLGFEESSGTKSDDEVETGPKWQ